MEDLAHTLKPKIDSELCKRQLKAARWLQRKAATHWERMPAISPDHPLTGPKKIAKNACRRACSGQLKTNKDSGLPC